MSRYNSSLLKKPHLLRPSTRYRSLRMVSEAGQRPAESNHCALRSFVRRIHNIIRLRSRAVHVLHLKLFEQTAPRWFPHQIVKLLITAAAALGLLIPCAGFPDEDDAAKDVSFKDTLRRDNGPAGKFPLGPFIEYRAYGDISAGDTLVSKNPLMARVSPGGTSPAVHGSGGGGWPVVPMSGNDGGGNDTAKASSPPAGEPRLSLSLRNIDILEALKYFSLKSGYNIVPTRKVIGRVTLNVENAPVKDVFDIMLKSNNLAYDLVGGIYNVMAEDEYRARYGKNFSDTRVVRVFHLKYAIPSQAFSLLEALKSEIGRLLVEPDSGSVMFIDTPEKIAAAEKALFALEQRNAVRVFNLKYARAKDVEEQLKNQLDLKKVGVIKADDRTNQVIVQTLPDRMKNIEELIRSLDKKTKGVLIDVKIVKIKLSNQNDRGVQWEGLFNLAKQYGLTYLGSYPFSQITAGQISQTFKTRENVFNSLGAQIGSYPFSGTTSSLNSSVKTTPGEKMHLGIVDGKRDFDVVVNYLNTLGTSKIIASPSLSVVNNQEAKIHIGERRAYITTTTTTGSTTSTVSEEVTYVDVGVRLSVIPTINDDGYITMKVKPEISSVIGNVISSSKNSIPIIDTNTAETTVIAKDGATIIIGGLGREEKAESTGGLPFFSRIPLLGFFFKNSTRSSERVELVIMLTPIIFEGDVFINARDVQRFKPKPFKKFDVFKPENPAERSREIFVPLSEKSIVPKGLRSYEVMQ